ncbi:MAG: DUF29 domain-containing protein [Spirulina sp.]
MESSLYRQDFVRWTERQITYIQQRKFEAIDWHNLQEEIAALGRSERRELENRLEVLLEHLLKRCYINSTYDNRGWELTIKEQRKQIRRLFRASPSLKNYFEEIFSEIWADALSDVREIYQGLIFPDDCPFPDDSDRLLTDIFWHDIAIDHLTEDTEK